MNDSMQTLFKIIIIGSLPTAVALADDTLATQKIVSPTPRLVFNLCDKHIALCFCVVTHQTQRNGHPQF